MQEQAKEKWEIARFLIDAKKAVDAIWYISKNVDALKNLDLRKKAQEKNREFYINCRIVIDKTFSIPQDKKSLKDSDSIIKAILTEADQNYAHKDPRYQPKPMLDWKELLDELKGQLTHLRSVCAKALPDCLTLNFVPHDKELFRQVHKISPEDEEEIKKIMHPEYGQPDPDLKNNPYPTLRFLHDIEQLKEEKDLGANYGTIVENGLNLHEGLQNRQDWCILSNYQFGTEMWLGTNPLKWNRNKACYCNSGKKYKYCCIDVD